MKVNTVFKENATAEYWDYTTSLDPINGRVDTYYKKSNVKVGLIPVRSGVLSVWCRTYLRRNVELRNLRDPEGNLVFADSEGNQVAGIVGLGEPVFNIFGVVEAYRHDVARGINA